MKTQFLSNYLNSSNTYATSIKAQECIIFKNYLNPVIWYSLDSPRGVLSYTSVSVIYQDVCIILYWPI